MFAACSLSDPQGVFPFSNPHGDEPSNNQFHIFPCLAFIHFCCSFKTFLLSRANSKFLNRFWMVFGKLPFQNSNWCGFAWFRELWEQGNCVYFQRRLKAFRCRQEPNSHQQVNLPHNPKYILNEKRDKIAKGLQRKWKEKNEWFNCRQEPNNSYRQVNLPQNLKWTKNGKEN